MDMQESLVIELFDLFQELLNIKTKEEFFTKFPTDVEIEHVGVELTTTLLRIEDKLNQRGWELSSYAAIHENGSMIPYLNIAEPEEFHQTVFRSIYMELFSVDVKELVNEYNALIDEFDKLGSHPERLDISQELIDDINSDLYGFENIVVVLQHRGYDGMTDVEFIEGLPFGSVSFFNKYSLEPLFERQIPQGAINIFGTMGLFKELESEGIPLSYEEQVIMLNSSSALIGTISSFTHSTDPNNEISLGMILSAIGAYHPSVDNLRSFESELLSSKEIPSLKIQEESDVAPLDVVCREGLQKIFKVDKSPACVKSETVEKLIERGWSSTMFSSPMEIIFREKIDYTVYPILSWDFEPSQRMPTVEIIENKPMTFEGIYNESGFMEFQNGKNSKFLTVKLNNVGHDSVVKVHGVIKEHNSPPKYTELTPLDYEVLYEKQEIIEKLNQISYLCDEIVNCVNENDKFSVSVVDECFFTEDDDLGNTYRWLSYQSKFVWDVWALNEARDDQDPLCVGGVYASVVFDMIQDKQLILKPII